MTNGQYRTAQQQNRIIFAASTDAGNRSMRANGRTVWNAEDYNTAAAEFARLAPMETVTQAKPVAKPRRTGKGRKK